MKRFSFRLDRILRLKQSLEDERALELADAIRAEGKTRRRVTDSQRRCREAERQIVRLRGGTPSAGSLQVAERALEAVRAQAQRDMDAQRAAEADVAKERQRFQEARQERLSLERIREKQHATWIAEANRLEQSDIDEIASRIKSRFGRLS